MAGSYPNALGVRFAYDADDTVVQLFTNFPNDSNSIVRLTSEQKAILNNENDDYIYVEDAWFDLITRPFLSVVFTHPRDITGIYYKATRSHLQHSTDTTNGIDGTWTNTGISPSTDSYRMVTPASLTGIRGFRIRSNNPLLSYIGSEVSMFHVYGKYTETERLAFWDSTANSALNGFDLDFGNTYISSTETKAFRLRNMSGTANAINVTITSNAITLGYSPYPAPEDQYLFSTDGINFYSSVSLSVVYPLSISDIIYVRRVTPLNAAHDSWSVRVLATVGEWH